MGQVKIEKLTRRIGFYILGQQQVQNQGYRNYNTAGVEESLRPQHLLHSLTPTCRRLKATIV